MTSKISSMDVTILSSSITAQRMRDFLGLSETDPPTDAVILQMIRVAEIITAADNISSLTTDQITLLTMMQTACQMSNNNIFNTTKTGITSYQVGKIGITFNTDAVIKTQNLFCGFYKELLSKFKKTSAGRGYVGMTNKGSGLALNTTKRDGPIYLNGDY